MTDSEQLLEVNDEVVKNIAELAQLKVDPEELKSLAEAMQNILDLAEQMQSIDTTNVRPVSNPLDAIQPLRNDVVTETNERDEFLAIAPATQDGLYLVPRVVE